MKNTKKIIAIVLALILFTSLAAACGGGLSGKYKLTSMTEGGSTFNAQQMVDMGLVVDDMYIEFLSGGKFKLSMLGTMTDGTYKLDGKTITLTSDGDSINATLDGKSITLSEGGAKMVFEK